VSELLSALREKSQFLSYDERAYLAQELMESIQHESPEGISEAWDVALQQRTADVASGAVQLIPADVVFAKAKQLTTN
jgi:putative addiction module component (TIGR02574 family)